MCVCLLFFFKFKTLSCLAQSERSLCFGFKRRKAYFPCDRSKTRHSGMNHCTSSNIQIKTFFSMVSCWPPLSPFETKKNRVMLLFLLWAFLYHPKNLRARFSYVYSQRHPLNFLCSFTVTTDFFPARLRPSPFFPAPKPHSAPIGPVVFSPLIWGPRPRAWLFFFFSFFLASFVNCGYGAVTKNFTAQPKTLAPCQWLANLQRPCRKFFSGGTFSFSCQIIFLFSSFMWIIVFLRLD